MDINIKDTVWSQKISHLVSLCVPNCWKNNTLFVVCQHLTKGWKPRVEAFTTSDSLWEQYRASPAANGVIAVI